MDPTQSQKDKKQKETEELLRLCDTQTQNIKQEVEKEPLVSDIFPIFALEEEFANAENFLIKTKSLSAYFAKKSFRKTRKDGSCFYRAFIYRLAEVLCMGETYFKRFEIFEKIKKASKAMLEAGFEKFVFEDFETYFTEFLLSIKNGTTNILNLHQALSDKLLYDYYVMYLRFVISSFIRTSGSMFEMYFESDHDLKVFCTKEVEPIDAEADQLQIISLYNALEIPIRIFYIDNSAKPTPTVFSLPDLNVNSDENVLATQGEYNVQLLYRPGHYDILY